MIESAAKNYRARCTDLSEIAAVPRRSASAKLFVSDRQTARVVAQMGSASSRRLQRPISITAGKSQELRKRLSLTPDATLPYSSPVLWEKGKVQPLPTLGSDPDGFPFAINDQGQAVGDSQDCTQTIIRDVLWENGKTCCLPAS